MPVYGLIIAHSRLLVTGLKGIATFVPASPSLSNGTQGLTGWPLGGTLSTGAKPARRARGHSRTRPHDWFSKSKGRRLPPFERRRETRKAVSALLVGAQGDRIASLAGLSWLTATQSGLRPSQDRCLTAALPGFAPPAFGQKMPLLPSNGGPVVDCLNVDFSAAPSGLEGFIRAALAEVPTIPVDGR